MKILLLMIFLTLSGWLHAQEDPERFRKEIDSYKMDSQVVSGQRGCILFTGSSTIRMWKTLQEDFPDQCVLNRGFGGSHVSDVVYFFNDLTENLDPSGIVLYAGDNDLASGKKPEKIFQDFIQFTRLVKNRFPNTWILYISAKPSPSRWSLRTSYERLNEIIKIFCGDQPGLLFIDTYPAMIGPENKPVPELYLQDSLHMSTAGYQLWKKIVQPYLIIATTEVKD